MNTTYEQYTNLFLIKYHNFVNLHERSGRIVG